MGEVAALRQLVGQVQELWDLYGANAHPLPRQGEPTKASSPPLPLAPPPLVTPLPPRALVRVLPAPRLVRIYSPRCGGGLQSHREFAGFATFLFVCRFVLIDLPRVLVSLNVSLTQTD